MENKCETISKYLMPLLRSMVARELVETQGLTQVQASAVLGTTQAAISQYLNSKRAIKGSDKFTKYIPLLQTIATQRAKQLVDKEITWKEITANFCNMCSTILNENPNGDDYII